MKITIHTCTFKPGINGYKQECFLREWPSIGELASLLNHTWGLEGEYGRALYNIPLGPYLFTGIISDTRDFYGRRAQYVYSIATSYLEYLRKITRLAYEDKVEATNYIITPIALEKVAAGKDNQTRIEVDLDLFHIKQSHYTMEIRPDLLKNIIEKLYSSKHVVLEHEPHRSLEDTLKLYVLVLKLIPPFIREKTTILSYHPIGGNRVLEIKLPVTLGSLPFSKKYFNTLHGLVEEPAANVIGKLGETQLEIMKKYADAFLTYVEYLEEYVDRVSNIIEEIDRIDWMVNRIIDRININSVEGFRELIIILNSHRRLIENTRYLRRILNEKMLELKHKLVNQAVELSHNGSVGRLVYTLITTLKVKKTLEPVTGNHWFKILAEILGELEDKLRTNIAHICLRDYQDLDSIYRLIGEENTRPCIVVYAHSYMDKILGYAKRLLGEGKKIFIEYNYMGGRKNVVEFIEKALEYFDRVCMVLETIIEHYDEIENVSSGVSRIIRDKLYSIDEFSDEIIDLLQRYINILDDPLKTVIEMKIDAITNRCGYKSLSKQLRRLYRSLR